MTALGAPIMETKVTMNGARERVPLPGFKNLATDKVGIELYEQMKDQYAGKSYDSLTVGRKIVRQKGRLLLEQLKAEGRLWRRNDGSRIT